MKVKNCMFPFIPQRRCKEFAFGFPEIFGGWHEAGATAGVFICVISDGSLWPPILEHDKRREYKWPGISCSSKYSVSKPL